MGSIDDYWRYGYGVNALREWTWNLLDLQLDFASYETHGFFHKESGCYYSGALEGSATSTVPWMRCSPLWFSMKASIATMF
jgi:hypothetical protein